MTKDLKGIDKIMPEFIALKKGQDNIKNYWNSFNIKGPGRFKRLYIRTLKRLLENAVGPDLIVIRRKKNTKTSCCDQTCTTCTETDITYPPSV